MGWGQATIWLDRCVFVVRFFSRASLTRVFFLSWTRMDFHVWFLRISLLVELFAF